MKRGICFENRSVFRLCFCLTKGFDHTLLPLVMEFGINVLFTKISDLCVRIFLFPFCLKMAPAFWVYLAITVKRLDRFSWNFKSTSLLQMQKQRKFKDFAPPSCSFKMATCLRFFFAVMVKRFDLRKLFQSP